MEKPQRAYDSSSTTTDSPTTKGGAGKSTLTSRLPVSMPALFRAAAAANAAAARDANGVADGAEAAVDRAASSSGSPLPTRVQRQFEGSLGADLSGVRVHTGAESAEAAQAVGAKAYTVGNDIHFAAGNYQPEDPFGTHLLAHEVAHTVQQAGGTSQRQHKLEVSTPQDAAEHEADAAADAMVAGKAATISALGSGAQRLVQRDDEAKGDEAKGDEAKGDEKAPGEFAEANKTWAEARRPGIQDVVDTTASAKEVVNGDAEASIGQIEAAQTSYNEYEKKYEAACTRFKNGVEAAQKADKELKESLSFVANTALGATFPMLAATKGAIGGVLETVNSAATLAGVVGIIPPAKGGAGESDKAMGPSNKVDWKALLQTTIDTFKKYLQQNKALDALAKDAGKNERYLAEVIEGKHDAVDAAASEAGQKVDTMEAEHMNIGMDLDGIAGNEVSTPAADFASAASTALDGLTPQKIEQDIAIKWISGLTREQRDEIDSADSYLKGLGVIDSKNNRLDYDTGDYTLDGDEVMIHLRAQVEQMAMAAIGTGEWMGKTSLNGGQARDANGIVWPAHSTTSDVSDKPGGQVQFNSYSFGPTKWVGDGSSRPGSEVEIKRLFISCCVFSVTPLGPTGGGVYEGPEIRPK